MLILEFSLDIIKISCRIINSENLCFITFIHRIKINGVMVVKEVFIKEFIQPIKHRIILHSVTIQNDIWVISSDIISVINKNTYGYGFFSFIIQCQIIIIIFSLEYRVVNLRIIYRDPA